ncbi:MULTISPECIES: hypothetical protein [unclassified Planococcus (in: firmicutes)]|uniref:hypothetical protein n=1 Tax=unclassified Planococcus (in: firmicutes) TaxID=2662419 RepID=UPI000C7B0D7C|nr:MULTISPECIES: hypothetical protein [unclassified Planococcus (in: firmicutes)]PKG44455.1 hypothetical protein CXF66_17075 [Planococcus sp. Urea-trap-24]PKG91271.1 hypothetical protein CXF91_02780 [Planococcus sp. Urea-3u-39]PKH37069.1 hypothetical protein CXF77_12725 [Planococcus sp. MB-3u-09]
MKLMLDVKEFMKKPEGGEVGNINNRIIKYPVDISLKELAKNIAKGKAFTPAYFQENEGAVKRQKSYWHSQQVVALDFDEGVTLEEAVNLFSDKAVFIYKTFSHTAHRHKFRVVFALDKPTYSIEALEKLLNRLLVAYPAADKQCKDSTRLFYGGTEIIEFNYNNRIKVTDFNDRVSGRTKEGELIYPVKNLKQSKTALIPKADSKSYSNKNKAKNIELIRQKNLNELHRRINAEPREVNNNFEMMDYLKQQDLRLFLGIEHSGSFIDVFHDESKPSAGIFLSSKDNGHQLYKCHSDSHPYVGTIFHIAQSLLGCSMGETRNFLMKVYRVNLVENETQQKLRIEIDCYKELLQSEDLEELYPNFYKLFSRYNYFSDLYVILDLVKEHLPAGDDPRLLFHHSLETIAKKLGRSTSSTHTRINIFAFFKLVTKLESHEVPPQLLEIQQASKQKKRHKYRNSTYELPLHNYDFFSELEKMSIIWLEKGCTTNSMNYEGVLRNFGLEEADRTFPQDKGRNITKLGEHVTKIITMSTMQLIEKYGFTTEQEILDTVQLYFKGQNKFKKKQFKICMGEMIEGYDLERIRLNKGLKIELDIDSKGFSYIIRQKKYVEEGKETPRSLNYSEILD